jgi:hypothetical protein
VGDTFLGANVWDPREFEPDDLNDDRNEDNAEEEDEEEPEVAAANQTGSTEETLSPEALAQKKIDQKKNHDAIRAQLAGKDHLLTQPAKTRARESPCGPTLATLFATLVKLEQMQKSR